MSDPETITIVVIAFFVLIALLTFARLLLRKQPPSWRILRLGMFVERIPRKGDNDDADDK
jgi:hypothetical protein